MKLEKIKKLRVDTPQGISGHLNKESRFSFNYLSAEKEVQASVSLPFRAESYASGGLFSIFAMNRPEGYLLDSLRHRFGKISVLDDMALLKITGKHQIGRLSYVDETDDIESKKPNISLDELRRSQASESLFEYLMDTCFDSGISGFQPKVMVLESDARPVVNRATAVTPNLIVKSAGAEYPHLTENEFLCMSVARECGFNVPEFWLSDDSGLFILKRFDSAHDGARLGLEDMCVLGNKTAEEKYHGSYEGIARVVATICGNESNNDLKSFFEYVATSVLLRNGDAHLKNFSVLYEHPGKQISLSPLYDVVTTAVYGVTNARTGMNLVDRTLALNLNKTKNYPDIRTLCEFGRKSCLIDNPDQIIERIEEAKIKVLADNRDRIDPDFLLEMRAAWNVGGYRASPPIRPRVVNPK